MEPKNPPAWLTDIRDYWACLTLKFADESGGPSGTEEANGQVAGAGDLNEPPPPQRPELRLPALTEDLD